MKISQAIDYSSPKNKSILITGGAGFIGSHLSDTLSKKNRVIVIDDLSMGKLNHVPDDAIFIEDDIRKESTFESVDEDIDIIFHHAALVSVGASVDDPTQSHSINVEATLRTLEFAREYSARVILPSSAAIYGHPESVPIVEEHSKEPLSPYGLDKLALDHYGRLYNELYGLETVVLRYFNAFGPRQSASDYSGVISVFLEQANAGEPLTVHGDGTQTRDFVHVSEIVRANLLAAETDHVGEAFNIGTGSETSINELAEAIVRLTDSESDIVHTDAQPGDIDQSRSEISKAKSHLGYEPQISLEEGIRSIIE